MRGEAENHQPADSGGAADDRSTEAGQGKIIGDAEKKLTGGRRESADDKQLARPPRVCQGANRNLHGDVEVEIECREVAQACGANAKIAHQFRRHDGWSGTQKEDCQIEDGADAPHGPRQPGGRIDLRFGWFGCAAGRHERFQSCARGVAGMAAAEITEAA